MAALTRPPANAIAIANTHGKKGLQLELELELTRHLTKLELILYTQPLLVPTVCNLGTYLRGSYAHQWLVGTLRHKPPSMHLSHLRPIYSQPCFLIVR